MPPHRPRVVRRVAWPAALLVVALTACSDDGAPTVTAPATTVAPAEGSSPPQTGSPTGNVVSVTVRGGSVEGASRQRVPLNQPAIVRVTSDVAEEVHIHGYDKKFPVAAGSTADFRFDANIPGVFEVEFERSHKLLFTLEVR